jgi:hypothetical protein
LLLLLLLLLCVVAFHLFTNKQSGEMSPGLALALENAAKLSEGGDLSSVEFISGPGDASRRLSILDKAYEVMCYFKLQLYTTFYEITVLVCAVF